LSLNRKSVLAASGLNRSVGDASTRAGESALGVAFSWHDYFKALKAYRTTRAGGIAIFFIFNMQIPLCAVYSGF
jgi:hypothetical protein